MTAAQQIIILTPGFPADEHDTSWIPALQDLVLAWKEAFPGVTIRVITFQYPHKSKSYTWHNIPVYAAGGSDKAGFRKLITWMKVWWQLLRIKRKKQTLLLSYFLTEATYAGQLFSQFIHIQHVAIAAGQDVKTENAYLRRLNFKKLIVVVFNERMNDELIRSTGKKADAIIPMGSFIPSSISGVHHHRPIDVLMVGSLIPLKQVDKAINIIAALKKDFPNLRTEIIGKGSERTTLEHLVNQLDLSTSILFTGAIHREAVAAKMMNAKILLHTSVYEGQSTVISEALSYGMYVVCFDVGRITDHQKIKVCTDENGLLNALKEILSSREMDFNPVLPFTMQETVAAYATLFQSALSSKNTLNTVIRSDKSF